MKKRYPVICIAVMVCFALGGITSSFAGKSISLKEVNSTNYEKYVKSVKAAYGYNMGECEREYLPHEEHFYSKYYDHWNVDAVYDRLLIDRLYTGFENEKPKITSVKRKRKGALVKWGKVKGAEKYIIYVKKGGEKWKKLSTVTDGKCLYRDKNRIKKGKGRRYMVQGVRHVRFWDVKTKKSDPRRIK